jgi:DHA1 family tetracycline resistance protein-like MFS transporter
MTSNPNFVNRLTHFLRSPMFPIFMIVFVDVLGLGITLPVLPLYAQNTFGATARDISLLASVYFVAQFFASPWLGRLSDRFGRRPVLILSQSGTLAALLTSGLAPGMLFLYLARMVDGLTGGNISVAQAYLSDITDEKNRASGLGVVNASFGSGFIIGPAFGALVAAQFGPRVPFFVAAGVSLLTVLLSFFLLPESLTPERRQQDLARKAGRPRVSNLAILRLPGIALIALVAFGAQFAFFSFQPTYVLWAERLLFPNREPQFVQQAIGGILTFVGVCGVVTQFWLVRPMVRRFGEKAMVAGGNAIRCLAWAVMALAPSVALVVLVTPLLAIGGGVSLPALIALLTYAAPPDQRGQVIGLTESVQGLGRILGPVVAGELFQRFSPSAPMMLSAVVSALTVAVSAGLWQLRVNPEKK